MLVLSNFSIVFPASDIPAKEKVGRLIESILEGRTIPTAPTNVYLNIPPFTKTHVGSNDSAFMQCTATPGTIFATHNNNP